MSTEAEELRAYAQTLEAALARSDEEKAQLLEHLTRVTEQLQQLCEGMIELRIGQQELLTLAAPTQDPVWDFRMSKLLS